jgi:hypothetical protein
MTLRRLRPLSLAFGLMATPAFADDAGVGTTLPEETEDSGGDEQEEEEEEKGCAHVAVPHNLAILGAGLLLFVAASRRRAPRD